MFSYQDTPTFLPGTDVTFKTYLVGVTEQGIAVDGFFGWEWNVVSKIEEVNCKKVLVQEMRYVGLLEPIKKEQIRAAERQFSMNPFARYLSTQQITEVSHCVT